MERDDSKALIDEYVGRRARYSEFAWNLQRLIGELCRVDDIALHASESRAKEVDSLRGKLERKQRYSTLQEIPDLCGVRVLTYYSGDVEKVAALLHRELMVLDRITHGDGTSETFGYASMHLIVQLDPVRRRMTEWRAYSDLKAEVQVRTVLQHGWATVSHKLDYKAAVEIPSQIRHGLARAAAFIEAADDSFDKFRNDVASLRHEYRTNAAADRWREFPLNLDSLESAWNFLAIDAVESAAESAGFERAGEGQLSGYRQFLGHLVRAAHSAQLDTIGELNAVMTRADRYIPALANMKQLALKAGLTLWIIPPDIVHMLLVIEDPRLLTHPDRPLFHQILESVLRDVAGKSA